MKQLLFFLLFFLQILHSTANTVHLSGYVEDAKSGEKLIGANVYLADKSIGTATNNYGYFSLKVPQSRLRICVSSLGYDTKCDTLVLVQDSLVYLALQPNVAMLEAFEINAAGTLEDGGINQRIGVVKLPLQQIKALPIILGETDPIKALQLLPGIQSGTEGSSGLLVRGGSSDQNLILLDGVPMYNVSHLFGFFSLFNANAIHDFTLIKGGFPARYGGRLSSVLDIRLKEGNLNEYHTDYTIGSLSANFMLEGPIKPKKSSFIISGRRTYSDLISRPITKVLTDGNTDLGYFFHDFSAKLNFQVSPKDRLYWSAYLGHDDLIFKDTFEQSFLSIENNDKVVDRFKLNWSNYLTSFRWNHLFGNKLFHNLTINFSQYNNQSISAKEEIITQQELGEVYVDSNFINNQFDTKIQDWIIQSDFDYYPTNNYQVKFGLGFTRHHFFPSQFSLNFTNNRQVLLDKVITYENSEASEWNAYFENEGIIANKLKINIGGRWSAWQDQYSFYQHFQPRIYAQYTPSERISIKAAYSRMVQFVHLLSNSSALNFPNDIWVPVNQYISPQYADQVSVGLITLVNNNIEISVEAYLKKMHQIIDFKDGISLIDNKNNWAEKVATGVGTARGLELLIHKKTGRLSGWVAYTLAYADRQFDEINFGEPFPYKYDRRHDLSISLIYQLKKRIQFSMNWVFGTGNALSLPTGQLVDIGPSNPFEPGRAYDTPLYYFASRNAYRLPNYHRLDIGFSFKKLKKKGERLWVIGLYNAYNRQNPFFIYGAINDVGTASFKAVSLFPILPGISYQRKI